MKMRFLAYFDSLFYTSMHFKNLKMLFLVLAFTIGTKKQYEIFHVPLPLNYHNN